MNDLFRSLTSALFLWIGFAAGEASGLVIYRFGGEDLEPPPEASGEGVEFIQLSWTDLDPSLGGETIELDIDAAIRAQKRDPTFNIAPGVEEKGEATSDPTSMDRSGMGTRALFGWQTDICAPNLRPIISSVLTISAPRARPIFF